jgi:hypothetical protein
MFVLVWTGCENLKCDSENHWSSMWLMDLVFIFIVGSKIHLVQCPWTLYLLKHISDFPPSPPPFNYVFQNVVHVMFHVAPFWNLCMHYICTNTVVFVPMLLRTERTKIMLLLVDLYLWFDNSISYFKPTYNWFW